MPLTPTWTSCTRTGMDTLIDEIRAVHCIAVLGALALCTSPAFGQTKEPDHIAVLEIGGAGGWGLTGGPASFGGTLAAESSHGATSFAVRLPRRAATRHRGDGDRPQAGQRAVGGSP